MTDYILVGQGLAGSLLSHFLIKKGKTVAFVDNNHRGASSAVAAGIINPITGRNFVKSWRTDELQPLAFSTYDELSALLGVQIFYPINVAVLFREIETSNNWLGRLSDPALEGYIAKEFDLNAYQKTFGNSVVSGAEFEQSGRCDIPTFILKWKEFICFENSNNDGYITEKIFNVFLAGSIPIYNGSPDVSKYLNIDSMLLFKDEEFSKKLDQMNSDKNVYDSVVNNSKISKDYNNEDWSTHLSKFLE
jgi:hypothetical protein